MMKYFNKIKKNNVKVFVLLFSFYFLLLNNQLTYGYYYDEEDYPEVFDAYWDNKTARWDVVGFASKFEIVLYRNGYRVVTKTSNSESINLSQYLTRGSGDYYFDVRPYNRYTGWGNWVGSDSIYIESSRYYDDQYYDDRYYDDKYYNERYDYVDNKSPLYNQGISYAKNQGPEINSIANNQAYGVASINPGNNQVQNPAMQNMSSITNKQNIIAPTPIVLRQDATSQNSFGNFVEMYGVWHFIYKNGVPVANAWVEYGNKWYYIDMNGIMAVGLYTINGVTYLLQADGSMAVGTVVIDGVTHFFNNAGAMVY
ncbi:MAG: hypothetical protein J6P02_04945 [Lachnospiraceae bacterium]|nr:hypothetical protein [Lachnospiraceae bacterium]